MSTLHFNNILLKTKHTIKFSYEIDVTQSIDNWRSNIIYDVNFITDVILSPVLPSL